MKGIFPLAFLLAAALQASPQRRLAALKVSPGSDTTEFPVHWIRDLPPAVKTAWKDCPYTSWLIFGIRKIVTPKQISYSIHVAQMQSLGPDDADIGSEYILFFSENGLLIAKQKLL